jgi:hypothetical protein
MDSVLRALVVSPDVDALQQIQAAFRATPDVELALHTDWSIPVQPSGSAEVSPNVLILHSDSPSEGLRKLRKNGFRQPALVLTADTDNPTIAPLEDDLRPLENVTWAVMRAGGLLHCITSLLAG